MLSQRIVTAVVLVALLLGGLFADEQKLWALVLGVFVSVAAWEWSCLAGCRQVKSRVLYSMLVTLALPFLYIFASSWTAGIVLMGTVWWCLAAVMVFYYQAGGQPVPASRPVSYLMGCFVLFPAWTGLMG
ncbi:MAG: phosphatidate cytidylyltransferase, partial [Gammaproteobacteria bacterium]